MYPSHDNYNLYTTKTSIFFNIVFLKVCVSQFIFASLKEVKISYINTIIYFLVFTQNQKKRIGDQTKKSKKRKHNMGKGKEIRHKKERKTETECQKKGNRT